jgi:hypothetical protein
MPTRRGSCSPLARLRAFPGWPDHARLRVAIETLERVAAGEST